MAYTYYQQQALPAYGTNQPFQFGAPPRPTFPTPANMLGGGHDFYRAHAANADPYLFDHAWNRVREYGGAPTGGMGVGLHEARHWHRRAYGAMNEVHLLAPEELGHAAAYEAYRTWIHNSFVYEPLGGDIERQREALTALAVAESARLLTFSSRPLDTYDRLAASEAAAHTASYIFYQAREERSRSTYRSEYDDPYAYDDNILYDRGRSRSRVGGHRSYSGHRSHSRHGSYSGTMPFPGQAYSSSSVSGIPQTAFPGSYAGSYAGSQSGIPVPMQGSVYGNPGGSGSVYGHTAPGMGHSYSAMPGVASSYGDYGDYDYTRGRSSSSLYSQQPYMGTAMSSSSMGMPIGTPMSASGMPVSGMPMGTAMSSSGVPMMPGQTIIIQKPRRKSRHRHHHRRSQSSDGNYDRYEDNRNYTY